METAATPAVSILPLLSSGIIGKLSG